MAGNKGTQSAKPTGNSTPVAGKPAQAGTQPFGGFYIRCGNRDSRREIPGRRGGMTVYFLAASCVQGRLLALAANRVNQDQHREQVLPDDQQG